MEGRRLGHKLRRYLRIWSAGFSLTEALQFSSVLSGRKMNDTQHSFPVEMLSHIVGLVL